MIQYGHFIGGKAVKGGSGRAGDVFQPMTGEVRAKVALASKAEVAAAVANAKAAQPAWAATNPRRRHWSASPRGLDPGRARKNAGRPGRRP